MKHYRQTFADVLGDISRDYHRRHQEALDLAASYHAHLLDGGDPYRHDAVSSIHSSGGLAPKYRVAIFREVEAERGEDSRPFAPAEVNRVAWLVTCRMHERLGDWLTLDEIWQGERYRQQMESMLGKRRMEGTAYRLEKGKKDGKVAYRLVRAEAVAA